MHLLCSKSRINPCKKKLTMPKLELNAAILLATLAKKVKGTLLKKFLVNDTHFFSDSQIVLAWLRTDVTQLQTYVANRVRSIGELTHSYEWHYVNTSDNPSDCLSRGIQPHELQNHVSWWQGPSFLHDRNYAFLPVPQTEIQLPELKKNNSLIVCTTTVDTHCSIFDGLKKYSSINKMTRILAYVIRFCNNIGANSVKRKGFVTADELDNALLLIVKHEQYQFYPDEIKSLQSGKQVTGSLMQLSPFIDGVGVIRVGGRLQNALLPYANRHAAILPKKSIITELIIMNEHIMLLHASQRLVLSSIKQRFWIPDGLRTVKKVIHKCVTCHRLKAAAATQLMGSLPSARVNACRPFEKVGVDFAGPVAVKNSRIRKPVIGKGYIALFVCFVTKAIHLELCSDLTTECFLACFKRFIARRNLPSDVYCDNGTTFKRARNKLDEFYILHFSQGVSWLFLWCSRLFCSRAWS
ncbi:uncharacterized protein LOC114351145 [Ostrinia furnacalis]|uniref:uncharacterized protein LOC114351145 n=1 Tax=Ostrinia furnacalis TaxID=93504 RepID=UPI00104030E8|nr:uncharacterized protein LOC114351145 [Ostrinia furnacalis]